MKKKKDWRGTRADRDTDTDSLALVATFLGVRFAVNRHNTQCDARGVRSSNTILLLFRPFKDLTGKTSDTTKVYESTAKRNKSAARAAFVRRAFYRDVRSGRKHF